MYVCFNSLNEKVVEWKSSGILGSPIACNRPDLKNDANYILLLEVLCLADVNIVEKEGEKTAKYQPLVRDAAS